MRSGIAVPALFAARVDDRDVRGRVIALRSRPGRGARNQRCRLPRRQDAGLRASTERTVPTRSILMNVGPDVRSSSVPNRVPLRRRKGPEGSFQAGVAGRDNAV